MADDPVLIKRYPNRRYYASTTSRYISLGEIEELVQSGRSVEIRDSQSGDDLTRAVLAQIIMERHPEKMSVFPTDMLHFLLRSNDVTTGLIREFFRHSSTYLDYLQRQNQAAESFLQPVNWVKLWLDSLSPSAGESPPDDTLPQSARLQERIEELEQRIRQLESPRE